MYEAQIERAKNLIRSPQSEWQVIDGESVNVAALYKTWIMPLAAIPAIAGFIGHSLFGVGAFGMHYRVPFFAGIFNALLSYVLTLGGVYAFAWILNVLAPYFGAKKNFYQALKISAYAPVAGWLAGVFLAIPMLSLLAFLGGLYSLYLLYIGLPILMVPSKDKKMMYLVAALVGALLLNIVLGQITQGLRSSAMPAPLSQISQQRAQDKQSKAMEKALQSGDLGGMMAALNGDSAKMVSDAEALKKLAPARLEGLKQVSLTVEKLDVPIHAITLKAKYEGKGDRHMTLTVMNSPGVNFLKTMAGFSGAMRSVKKDDGSFEKLSKEKDRLVMQSWDAPSARGNYAWSYKNFIVSLEGRNVPVKTLRKAAGVITSAELDGLPTG